MATASTTLPYPSAPRVGALPRALAAASRFEVLVAASVLALVLAFLPRTLADPDIWWHLRNASVLLSHPAALRHDTYSFTATGAPWIDHEWLSELVFYAGWRLAGAAGVLAVEASLVLLLFGGLFALVWRASRGVLPAALATLGAALLATVSFGPRTLLTGWVCLVVQLLVVDFAPRYPRLLLFLPVLYAFWVNLHGSWMIGLVVLALLTLLPLLPFAADAPGLWRAEGIAAEPPTPAMRRLLVPAWTGVFAALFLNPWGWRLVWYPFDFAFQQKLNVASVEEWQALDWHSLRGRVVVAAVALAVGRQFWRPRRWTLRELALVALGLYAGVLYSRFLFLLGLLAAPVVARSFGPRREAKPLGKPWWNLAFLGALLSLGVGCAVALLVRQPAQDERLRATYPSEAALAALDRLPPGARVFNEFLWGGYLEWTRPARRVFVDSRVDLFERNGTFADYLDTIHLVRPEAVLDRDRIDAVLFAPGTPLVLFLERSGAWQPRFQDAHTVLLVRTHPLAP